MIVFKFEDKEHNAAFIIATDYEEANKLMAEQTLVPFTYVGEKKMTEDQILKKTPALIWINKIPTF